VKKHTTLFVIVTKGNPKAAQQARALNIKVVQADNEFATAVGLVLKVVPDARARAAAGGAGGHGGHGGHTVRGRDSAGEVVELNEAGQRKLQLTTTKAQRTRNCQELDVQVQGKCVKALATVGKCPDCEGNLRPFVGFRKHVLGCYRNGCKFVMSWDNVNDAAAAFDARYAVGPPDIARHVIHGGKHLPGFARRRAPLQGMPFNPINQNSNALDDVAGNIDQTLGGGATSAAAAAATAAAATTAAAAAAAAAASTAGGPPRRAGDGRGHGGQPRDGGGGGGSGGGGGGGGGCRSTPECRRGGASITKTLAT